MISAKNAKISAVGSLGLMVMALTGCDMLDMPSKMDATLEGIRQTNATVKESNHGIEETNGDIHKQKLLIALDDMFKSEHTEYLIPPTGMLAGGETFAEAATTEEVMKLAYVWLKEIEEAQPDESLRGENGKFSDAVIAKSDHEKQIKWTALQVIAGLIPQKPRFDSEGRRLSPLNSVEEIVETQINQGGRYEDTAYVVLLARSLFLNDLLIQPLLKEDKITNPGKAQEAYERISYYDYLAHLSFVDKIQYKSHGMLISDDNIDEKFNPKAALKMWTDLDKAVDSAMDPRFRQDRRIVPLKVEIQNRIQALK